MEVIMPTQEMGFDFSCARNSPYPSAPSSPRGFGDYFYSSAPTSPSRLSEFYQEFDGFQSFDDFAFDVCEEVNQTSVPAEYLFDGGMIKPMNTPLPPPQPKKENINYPFGIEEEGTRESRGRERNSTLSSASRRAARSVSPLRVSQYPWEEEEKEEEEEEEKQKQSSSSSALTSSSSGKSQKKWRLKDFLLFRSASEGRARESDKDGLTKYISLFRGSEVPGATNGSVSKRRNSAQISGAAKEGLKKKTFLPYKPGFFGRIQFNPAMATANGFPVYK